MNVAKRVLAYYESEDFEQDYVAALYERFHDEESNIIARIREICEYEYYFEKDYGRNVKISEEQATRIYKHIDENFEKFVSRFHSYYVGSLSLESCSFGEQEEQLEGLYNHRTGKDYSMKYLRYIFDKENFYVADDRNYAYYDMSSEGVHVQIVVSELKDLLDELVKNS